MSFWKKIVKAVKDSTITNIVTKNKISNLVIRTRNLPKDMTKLLK